MPFDLSNPAETALRQFLNDNQVALLRAARLLGGEAFAVRLHRLISQHQGSAILRKEARALHSLLTLQNVGDPDRIETSRFAMIDMGDPRIPEICCLADQLETVLDTCATARPAPRAA